MCFCRIFFSNVRGMHTFPGLGGKCYWFACIGSLVYAGIFQEEVLISSASTPVWQSNWICLCQVVVSEQLDLCFKGSLMYPCSKVLSLFSDAVAWVCCLEGLKTMPPKDDAETAKLKKELQDLIQKCKAGFHFSADKYLLELNIQFFPPKLPNRKSKKLWQTQPCLSLPQR